MNLETVRGACGMTLWTDGVDLKMFDKNNAHEIEEPF